MISIRYCFVLGHQYYSTGLPIAGGELQGDISPRLGDISCGLETPEGCRGQGLHNSFKCLPILEDSVATGIAVQILNNCLLEDMSSYPQVWQHFFIQSLATYFEMQALI